ncbi:MAG: DUF1641 domain-containing protein [Acidobacteriaceae bacterium]
MANPLRFKPMAGDPQQELERRLAAAPRQHSEALLVAWDLLQTAHDQGILDIAQGLIGGRDAIATQLAAAANRPESIAALRNLIAMGRVLASLDPATLDHLARALDGAAREKEAEQKPPSLWRLFRRMASEDGRRGLSFVTTVLTGLGRSTVR